MSAGSIGHSGRNSSPFALNFTGQQQLIYTLLDLREMSGQVFVLAHQKNWLRKPGAAAHKFTTNITLILAASMRGFTCKKLIIVSGEGAIKTAFIMAFGESQKFHTSGPKTPAHFKFLSHHQFRRPLASRLKRIPSRLCNKSTSAFVGLSLSLSFQFVHAYSRCIADAFQYCSKIEKLCKSKKLAKDNCTRLLLSLVGALVSMLQFRSSFQSVQFCAL
jgi:hypothetical protein